MENEVILTHEGVQEIEKKLDYLKIVKRMEVAEQIKTARAFGDLSENAEYDAAKNEQARIEMEILNLEKMLKIATVVDEKSVSKDVVNVGNSVKVLDVEFGEEENYYIVGSAEANVAKNKISNESPVGRALLGKPAGSIVSAVTPAGVIELKILEIY